MKKLIIMISIVAVIFIFPKKVSAERKYYIYSLEEYENCKEKIEKIPCKMPKKCNDEEKAKILFKRLLNKSENVVNYIPKGTTLMDIKISKKNGEMIINVSKEIKNYGGSFYEVKLVKQILYTGFEIENVKYITLLIEGKADYLPEGSSIDKISREELRRYES